MSTDRFTMSVSPDFPPKFISGWYIFNTWLQRELDIASRLDLHDSFEQQRKTIAADAIDIIYANPYDASMLVREKGFIAVATPLNRADEALIAVNAQSAIEAVESLESPLRIACTDDPEVNLIARMMLEPADLAHDALHESIHDTYVVVAKQVLNGEADVGFFLKGGYDEFSTIIRDQLRVIISSEIQVIQHLLLLGPRLASRREELLAKLLTMQDNPRGHGILDSMDLVGWQEQGLEDTEFMIDLMETLNG